MTILIVVEDNKFGLLKFVGVVVVSLITHFCVNVQRYQSFIQGILK